MDEQAFEYKADYKPASDYKPDRYRLRGKALWRIVLLYSAAALFAAIAGFLVAFMLTGANPAQVINALPGLTPRPGLYVSAATQDNGLHELIRHAEPKPVPDLSFSGGDGRAKRLSDFSGKVVVLNFWATWCAPCKVEMPALDRLQAALGGPDFEVVALSIDRTGPDKPRAFLEQGGMSHLALYNDETGESAIKVKAGGVPVTLILDREGREVARLLGTAEWDSPQALRVVAQFIER